jgi:hypothetical protein
MRAVALISASNACEIRPGDSAGTVARLVVTGLGTLTKRIGPDFLSKFPAATCPETRSLQSGNWVVSHPAGKINDQKFSYLAWTTEFQRVQVHPTGDGGFCEDERTVHLHLRQHKNHLHLQG